MTFSVVEPDEDAGVALALLNLQRSAYAVEAALIGDDRIPPLWETLDDLRSRNLLWLLSHDGGALEGAVAWTKSPDFLDIDRLVVNPSSHRRGTGSALVREVIARARSTSRSVVVSTGRDNAPARKLYESLEFFHQGDAEILPGLWVAEYQLPCGLRRDVGTA